MHQGGALGWGPPYPVLVPWLLQAWSRFVSSVSPRIKLEMTVGSSRQTGGRDKGHRNGLSAGCHPWSVPGPPFLTWSPPPCYVLPVGLSCSPGHFCPRPVKGPT